MQGTMDTLAHIWKALKDGRPMTTTQLYIIAIIGIFGLGFNYVLPSYNSDIYELWPHIGISLSFIVAVVCFLAIPFGKREEWSVHQIRLSLCMVFFASCIRQYEENILDCMQRQGSFIPFANGLIDAWLPGFHCDNIENCVFDKYNTMAYNTAGLWPIYMLVPFIFHSTPFLAECACGVALVSSLGHVASSAVMLSYSPGTAAALVLVCPSASYAATLIANHYFCAHPSVHVASAAAGAFCHAGVGFTFFIANILKLLPEEIFPFFMYGVFSIDMGLVCRLFGGPLEKFIVKKKHIRSNEHYATISGDMMDEDDEGSTLLL